MDVTEYPRPAVAVDLVILTIVDADLKVLLVERGEEPFLGCLALPGGFVRVDEDPDLDSAARRELAEETNLNEHSVYLEQLYTFGDAQRDPRMRVITVAYYALVRPTLAPLVSAGGDAAGVRWRSTSEVSELAFDHDKILQAAIERVRGKVDYTNIAFELVPETFTIPELRAVHEVIKGTSYDPGNFRRRFKRMLTDEVIEEAPGKRITSTKPAKVYRFRG